MENRFGQFVYLVSSINRYVRKIRTEELSEYNFKGTHIMCLYYIDKLNEVTAKELCDLTGEDKSAVSRSLDFLEKSGFIKNDGEEGKKYKTTYSLTEKGKEVSVHLGNKVDESIANAGVGLTYEEREIMYHALKIINKNLEEICQKY